MSNFFFFSELARLRSFSLFFFSFPSLPGIQRRGEEGGEGGIERRGEEGGECREGGIGT